MDLSLSLSLSLALVVTISKESWREIAQREKPKEKCALGKKRPHTQQKKLYPPWDYTFSSLCVPVGENVFAHILGRALR